MNQHNTRDISANGDVIGSDVSGSHNIIGKGIKIVNRTVIQIVNPSKEAVAELRKIMDLNTSIAIMQERSKGTAIKDSRITEGHVNKLLNVMEKVDLKTGKRTNKISLNSLQITRSDLLFKKFMLEGNRYFIAKKYGKAITAYEKAIEITPDNVDAWNNRGYAFYLLGKADQAIESFDKSLSIQPNYITALGNKAEVYASSDRYIEALEYYNKILLIDDSRSDAWYNKGIVLSRMGRDRESKKCFAAAKRLQIR